LNSEDVSLYEGVKTAGHETSSSVTGCKPNVGLGKDGVAASLVVVNRSLRGVEGAEEDFVGEGSALALAVGKRSTLAALRRLQLFCKGLEGMVSRFVGDLASALTRGGLIT
jgi:hypothetical protein